MCTVLLSSLLGIGHTCAVFHDEGNIPWLRDELKHFRRTGAKVVDVFLRARLDIKSGPGALPSGSVLRIEVMLLKERVMEQSLEDGCG